MQHPPRVARALGLGKKADAGEKGGALEVRKLNVDDNPNVTRKYGVMSIPSLILFKDGEEKARVVGARGKEAILKEIEPHISA